MWLSGTQVFLSLSLFSPFLERFFVLAFFGGGEGTWYSSLGSFVLRISDLRICLVQTAAICTV